MEMDRKIFRDINYGMYFLSSNTRDKKVGCVINTLCQITSNNPIISISLNKDNYTSEVIKESRKFSISIMSIDTKGDVIGKFGYYSSRECDKFEGINYDVIDGLPIVVENICGYLICEVIDIVDCDSHDIIIARVVDTKKISDKEAMSYKYYQDNLKGSSPKNAPTYVEKEESSNGNKYRCKLCGYIYDDSKETIKFEDLPSDWKCPLCGAGKEMFEKI